MKIVVKDPSGKSICESDNVGFVHVELEDNDVARYQTKLASKIVSNAVSSTFYNFKNQES